MKMTMAVERLKNSGVGRRAEEVRAVVRGRRGELPEDLGEPYGVARQPDRRDSPGGVREDRSGRGLSSGGPGTRRGRASRPASVILMPRYSGVRPGHQAHYEDGDHDVHDHVCEADALPAWGGLDQHPHEAPEDDERVHRCERGVHRPCRDRSRHHRPEGGHEAAYPGLDARARLGRSSGRTRWPRSMMKRR